MQIGAVKRVRLGELPTPLQEMANLEKVLGGPRLFIKRDDLTGLGTGGNKLRKLEYALAEAMELGATAVVTTGAVQSNHAQLTTAAANRLGMKTFLILKGDKPHQPSGNLFLDRLLGVEEIRYVAVPSDSGKEEFESLLQNEVDRLMAELRKRGEVPYYIPNGCKAIHGALGYAGCVYEIVGQLRAMNLAPNYIVTACGTSGTQTGLVLGSILYGQGEIKVLGMSVSEKRDKLEERIRRNLREAAASLELRIEEVALQDAAVVYDEYIGEGYGKPTDAMREAVRLVASEEGIILDPVYTGKAMSGLIDLVHRGSFSRDDVVVFLHTGGIGGLFVPDQVSALLADQP